MEGSGFPRHVLGSFKLRGPAAKGIISSSTDSARNHNLMEIRRITLDPLRQNIIGPDEAVSRFVCIDQTFFAEMASSCRPLSIRADSVLNDIKVNRIADEAR